MGFYVVLVYLIFVLLVMFDFCVCIVIVVNDVGELMDE